MGMEKSNYKIHIVGAGISGLIAALVLEEKGYSPIIIEATNSIGGRVKTDVVDGVPLDHGFQVMLTAYPMVNKYLNLKALELCYFQSGATIYTKDGVTKIGDPLRNPSLLFPTLWSSLATLGDKIKIFKLRQELKRKSIARIFDTPEQSTRSYLKERGFSETVIQQFFAPFFSGIFLENDLQTSSRMFEFVYKMFGEGLAAIPRQGIGAIPKQLRSKLKRTRFLLDTEVFEVKDDLITLKDGTKLDTHFTIIATDANTMVSNLRKQGVQWKRCDTFYFEVPRMKSRAKLIGLVADGDALVNTIVSLSTLFGLPNKKDILSVTAVKQHPWSSEELGTKVSEELRKILGIEAPQLLRHYAIPKALPEISNLKNDLEPEETRLTTRIFLAGDTLLNGSLNAAMKAGERAAYGVVNLLEDSPDLAQFTTEYL